MPDPSGGGVIIIHGLNTPAQEVDSNKSTMTALMAYCSVPNTAPTVVKNLYSAINTMLANIT